MEENKMKKVVASLLTVILLMSFAATALADLTLWIKINNYELVNIREEPFSDAKVAFWLPNGAQITDIAWADPTWSKIRVANHPGTYYVKTRFLSPTDPTPSGAWVFRYGSATLKRGSTGTYVKNLQRDLKKLGYYTGSIDGDFGPATEKAVKAFQKSRGLTQDGKVGSQTRPLLWKKRFGCIN